MKRMMAVGAGMALMLCIAAAGPAGGAAGVEAGGYDAAKAHDPHFSDLTVWPENLQVGRAAYAKENWPKGRVLVWADTNPKTSKGLDPANPANWLEAGKPATEPLDANCDVVFPASKTPYQVEGKKIPTQVRHITIEAGCSLWGWGIGHSGNTWIKKGGSYGGGSGSCRGAKNTFMRNDSDRIVMLANGLQIAKAKDASVEFINGPFGGFDDLMFDSGTCIVGPDSFLRGGDRSTQAIYPGSRLILMSGATFSKRAVQPGQGADMIIGQGGLLQAGTPERPLTKDCFLGLSWQGRQRAGKGLDLWHLNHAYGGQNAGDVGMIVLPEGKIEVTPAPGKKAHLVFLLNRLPPDSAHFTEDMVKDIPHKIDVVFLGPTVLSGIELRDVNKGGIMLAEPSVRQKWTDVIFSEGCDGKADELCVQLGNFKPTIDVQGWDTKKLYKKN